MPLLCHASLRGTVRASLLREAPAGSRSGRTLPSQPKPASACKMLRGGPCLANRQNASRGACSLACAAIGCWACTERPSARGAALAASSPENADEPEQELKQQHVANLGKIRTEAQRQRVRTWHTWWPGCRRG